MTQTTEQITEIVPLPSSSEEPEEFSNENSSEEQKGYQATALDKPHWQLGINLMPHHFQYQDSYHESLVATQIEALFDYPWGIVHIDLDEQAIESGHISLRELRAILPDGLPIACGTKEAPAAPSRIVRELGEGESLQVYVGVANAHPGTVNVDDVADPTSHRRYTRDVIQVFDLQNGTKEPVEVGRLRPNVTLLFERERLDGFVTLPIARVVRKDGRLAYEESYIAPVLQVRGSRSLEQELRKLLGSLLEQQKALEDMVSNENNALWRRWALSVVSSHAAIVADIVEQGHHHPRDVHWQLCRLYGSLTAFTPQREPAAPPFKYRELGETFRFLFENITTMLNALGTEQYRIIPVRSYDANTLHVELVEPAIFRNEFFLCVQGADAEMVRGQVPRTIRLAAWNQLNAVRQAAVSGVPLLPMAVAPAILPQSPGAVYFRLDKKGDAFEQILRSGHLGIDVNMPDVKVTLFAVDPRHL
ncbi:MAG: type VI secretion system baseplate subunit TssK [Polyangiaceae bacterium]|nr:type VI secretion system baseplate subunit TssK [Polyangiaceae bacterium]